MEMTLNEGRGINPGDTSLVSDENAGRGQGAQRRPGHQPRRHVRKADFARRVHARSTKAGASTPATLLWWNWPRHGCERSTKAGASTPATLSVLLDSDGNLVRSTKAGASTPATPDQEFIGGGALQRSTKAGASTPATRAAACRRAPRPAATLNEGRGINPGDTASGRTRSTWRTSLNEGRGINPGDTRRDIRQDSPTLLKRSTKAGASTPATRWKGGK